MSSLHSDGGTSFYLASATVSRSSFLERFLHCYFPAPEPVRERLAYREPQSLHQSVVLCKHQDSVSSFSPPPDMNPGLGSCHRLAPCSRNTPCSFLQMPLCLLLTRQTILLHHHQLTRPHSHRRAQLRPHLLTVFPGHRRQKQRPSFTSGNCSLY